MENKMNLSVVIPTYNEEKNIKNTLREIDKFFMDEHLNGEIIISDDGSKDKTISEIKSIVKEIKVKTILLENPHLGKGPAVRTGVLKARCDYILFMDADFATPIKEFKRLVVWLTEHSYDIAIASREGLGSFRKGEPYYRHLMGRVFNFFVQVIALSGVSDSQCGFKLFKKTTAHKVFGLLKEYSGNKEIKDPYLGAFDVEVLLIARIIGFKIKEVPVLWTYHEGKRLNIVRDSIKMLWDILKIRINALKGYYK